MVDALLKHFLLTADHVERTNSRLAAGLRRFPRLPEPNTDPKSEFDHFDNPLVAWRQEGFEIMSALAQVRGPIVEIGGPTPIWYDPSIRDGGPWGALLNIRHLPKPLIVTNILPIDEACGYVIGPYAGETFVQADGTRFPCRDASVGAILVRGISLMTGWEEYDTHDLVEPSNTIRLGVFDEAWRVVEPGGIFFLRGARLDEVAYLRSIGFELCLYQADSNPTRSALPIAENVYRKPRS